MVALLAVFVFLYIGATKRIRTVPLDLRSEVMELAMHGGDFHKSRSIALPEEHFELINEAISAHEAVAEARRAVRVAEKVEKPAPGLPDAYRQQMLGRREKAVTSVRETLALAEQRLSEARSSLQALAENAPLNESTCEKWHRLWSKHHSGNSWPDWRSSAS